MLNITKYDNARIGCGYRYTITNGCTAYTAYRENDGIQKFLDIIEKPIIWTRENEKIVTTLNRDHEVIDKNKPVFFSCGYIEHTIREHYFYTLDELPKGVKKTIDHSNGTLTYCYYITDGDITDYYRPNPNAKSEQGGAYIKAFDKWETERKYRLKYC